MCGAGANPVARPPPLHSPRVFFEHEPGNESALVIGGPGGDPGSIFELLVHFARLSLQLFCVDVNTLTGNDAPNEEPDLISLRYQITLSWILLPHSSPDVLLWRVLRDQYAYDVDQLLTAVSTTFLAGPVNGLQLVCRFTDLVFGRVAQCPRLCKVLGQPVWIAQRLIDMAVERLAAAAAAAAATDENDDDRQAAVWRRLARDCADLCRNIDQRLDAIVVKQVNVPRDSVKDLCHGVAQILEGVAKVDPESGRRLLKEREYALAGAVGVGVDELPQLLARSWKFHLLRKCIVHGRMEVRVQGLDTMCNDLVEAYKYFGVAVPHPVMQYLADFILGNNLLEYLVGVNSHIQLVERSANVAGFLVVTGRYTPHQTDIIWQMVKTHQDPRFVAAILRMLKGIFNVSFYPTLLYLCEKLNELPVQSFDLAVIDYASNLLSHLREKCRPMPPPARMEMPPYRLCIRLVRQVTPSTHSSPTGNPAVSQFAFGQLLELLPLGPSAEDRKAIYLACLEDITAKNSYSTGSIRVLNALLQQVRVSRDATDDLERLTSDHDLTRLVIEETACALRHDKGHLPPQNNDVVLGSRLEVVSRIIARAPLTISDSLADRLWHCLAENDALDTGQRDMAWNMLCSVTTRLRARNPFIDRCIETYLPRLPSRHFTPGVLSMVQQVIQYEHRMAPQRLPREGDIIDITGSELLWRLILNAPERTIEQQAIRCLVGFYLDAAIARTVPQSTVEATYLALADRCIRQLTDAATKLRASGGGESHANGDDGPMAVLRSEPETAAEESCFSRSLMFLRDFIRGLRERPYFMSRLIPASGGLTNGDVAAAAAAAAAGSPGDIIRLRYQALALEKPASAMRELEIGDLETCRTLRHRLTHETGFNNFRIISGGQEVDLDMVAAKSIREVQLASHPLMISRAVKPATLEVSQTSSEGLTIVELEVMKHFDELYELLGLEERLASQVGHPHPWDPDRFPPLLYADTETEIPAVGVLECLPSTRQTDKVRNVRSLGRCRVSLGPTVQGHVLSCDDGRCSRNAIADGSHPLC